MTRNQNKICSKAPARASDFCAEFAGFGGTGAVIVTALRNVTALVPVWSRRIFLVFEVQCSIPLPDVFCDIYGDSVFSKIVSISFVGREERESAPFLPTLSPTFRVLEAKEDLEDALTTASTIKSYATTTEPQDPNVIR